MASLLCSAPTGTAPGAQLHEQPQGVRMPWSRPLGFPGIEVSPGNLSLSGSRVLEALGVDKEDAHRVEFVDKKC